MNKDPAQMEGKAFQHLVQVKGQTNEVVWSSWLCGTVEGPKPESEELGSVLNIDCSLGFESYLRFPCWKDFLMETKGQRET